MQNQNLIFLLYVYSFEGRKVTELNMDQSYAQMVVMDFDGDRFPFFKVFAGVCVTRHIITAVKAASRKKHLPLNSYVSLDKNTYDDDSDTTLLDIIAFSELQDPEAILIDRENMDGMEYKINKVLSKLETEVLVYYLEGLSYQEIAEKLGKDTKAVDNAVQRIKKKLESALREGDEGNY